MAVDQVSDWHKFDKSSHSIVTCYWPSKRYFSWIDGSRQSFDLGLLWENIFKLFFSETTKAFDFKIRWNSSLMDCLFHRYMFFKSILKSMMAANTIQSFCMLSYWKMWTIFGGFLSERQKLEIWWNINYTWKKFQIMFGLYIQMVVTAGNSL